MRICGNRDPLRRAQGADKESQEGEIESQGADKESQVVENETQDAEERSLEANESLGIKKQEPSDSCKGGFFKEDRITFVNCIDSLGLLCSNYR